MTRKIPNDMSYSQAAVLPVVFATAYYALYDIARMRKGETVLIHWGAGGVGQAAIQLAQLIGAEIFVTVGSTEKRNLMTQTFGIPHDHIFSSRDLTFAQGMMRMTNNRGVDVVLNSMAGEGLRRSWECIAPFGRFVEIGKADIGASGKLPMFPFKKNVVFASVDLAFMVREDESMLAKTLSSVMDLAREKKISCSTPLNVFPYGKLQEAFRLMQSGKHLGKIVLEIQDGDTIMVSSFLWPYLMATTNILQRRRLQSRSLVGILIVTQAMSFLEDLVVWAEAWLVGWSLEMRVTSSCFHALVRRTKLQKH